MRCSVQTVGWDRDPDDRSSGAVHRGFSNLDGSFFQHIKYAGQFVSMPINSLTSCLAV